VKSLAFAALTGVAFAAPASGQDAVFTANSQMPGCRSALTAIERSTKPDLVGALGAGQCIGAINTLLMLAAADQFSPPYRLCFAEGVSTPQIVRVVVRYIDARPERQHQSFTLLAMEAVRAAWPCPR